MSKFNTINELEICQVDDRIERELREMAYFRWEHAGKPEGRDVEFWCDAEREMFGMTTDEYWKEHDVYFREIANLSGDAFLIYHGIQ